MTIPFDELMKKGKDYMDGFQEGRVSAVKQYDEVLLFICNQLGEIQGKLDILQADLSDIRTNSRGSKNE